MSNQYARELQRCQRAINRLDRNHSLSDTSLGEILMDIQVEVSATVIEAVRNKAINLNIKLPPREVRGRALLAFWQQLQAIAYQNGYGADPNRISDRVVQLKGNRHDLHESTYRRWIPNAIATVEFLLRQLGRTASIPVLSAQWGKGTKWIDVTQQILWLLADKSPFDAASDDFGVEDPVENRKKQLRLIFASTPPIVRILNEGEVVSYGGSVIDTDVGRAATELEADAAITWKDRNAGTASKSKAQATSKAVCPIELRGDGIKPLVGGDEANELFGDDYKIIDALVRVWPKGRTKGQLEAEGFDSPNKRLDKIRKRSQQWSNHIHLPGKNGRGGYRVI